MNRLIDENLGGANSHELASLAARVEEEPLYQEFMDKMRSEESEAKRQEEEQAREQKTKLIIDQAAVRWH